MREHPLRLQPPPLGYISDWLAARIRKPQPHWFRRWLGEPSEFSYRLAMTQPRESPFFERHVLFSVVGELGLLPFAALPSGSSGLFAFDGTELRLLAPGDDSLAQVLRAEGRSLSLADPVELAQLVCDVQLRRGVARGHTVLRDRAALEHFSAGPYPNYEYEVDRVELERVGAAIVAACIEGDANTGWVLRFTTVYGWMHDLLELGVETVHVTPEYTLRCDSRTVLSRRIFSRVPMLMY